MISASGEPISSGCFHWSGLGLKDCTCSYIGVNVFDGTDYHLRAAKQPKYGVLPPINMSTSIQVVLSHMRKRLTSGTHV